MNIVGMSLSTKLACTGFFYKGHIPFFEGAKKILYKKNLPLGNNRREGGQNILVFKERLVLASAP